MLGNGAYQLAESAVDLIERQIRDNIAQALANVRAERNDPIVTTEPPKEYLQYEEAQAYRTPAVFTIIQDMDIRNDTMKANHINAMDRIVVAVVVEDRNKARIVKKAWRYQAALMQCLHLVSLTTVDSTLRLFSRVRKCSFSGIVDIRDEKAAENVFRKEISLELAVEHIENLE